MPAPARLSPILARLACAACLVLGACDFSRSYEVKGRVAGFGDDGRTVIVEHEEVPGLMPAMTMPFRTNERAAVAQLRPGQAVGFTLHVAQDSTWITDLAPLPDEAVARDPEGNDASTADPSAAALLRVGDPAPAFTLIAHTGDPLEAADLTGRAWLVTFIYTRCPLPEYCPLLSQRFRRLQEPLRTRFGPRVHLLSVTFDPAHDTPAVLTDYARRYGADASAWTFATGEPDEIRRLAQAFGVYYQDAGREITHNLVTGLVGPDGRVAALWPGNDWTEAEALEAVARALD